MGTVVWTLTMAGPRALLLLLLITLGLECVSSAKKIRPCKYNGKSYKAGEMIVSQEDNCVELRCSNKGKNMELVLIKGCSSACKEAPTTTTESPKPATDDKDKDKA